MLEFVEHLFTYQFLNRALITSIIVGIVCGTVGSLIVLRGLSLMGDAMSHAVLPGVALSFLFGIPMFVGALITGMIASIFIGYITSSSKTKPDAAIGISFTAFLASGIIIISLINTTTDLYHILFGIYWQSQIVHFNNYCDWFNRPYSNHYFLSSINDFYIRSNV